MGEAIFSCSSLAGRAGWEIVTGPLNHPFELPVCGMQAPPPVTFTSMTYPTMTMGPTGVV